MCFGFLFRTTHSSFDTASGRFRRKRPIKLVGPVQITPFGAVTIQRVLLFLLLVALSTIYFGCTDKEKREASTPTSGSLAVFASPAVESVIQSGADQFNRLYQKANVNVYALNSRAIVDSMINRRCDIGYFDRSLSEAESLAVVATRKHLYSFLLGSTVATWIVHPENSITLIDSIQALEILTGKMMSWKAFGGSDDSIHVYLPSLGDGAWVALQDFFGDALNKVNAYYLPSDSLVVARVAEDPTGLGFVGGQAYNQAVELRQKVKKLRWRHPMLADPVPANIGSLQEGKYPFRIHLYYYTIADQTDLASGFLSFMASNPGQKIIADHGYLPAMVPVRIVNLSSNPE